MYMQTHVCTCVLRPNNSNLYSAYSECISLMEKQLAIENTEKQQSKLKKQFFRALSQELRLQRSTLVSQQTRF